MLILYVIIVFFIIIFNVILPIILDKITIENQIINSEKGKNFLKITCSDNFWFYVEQTVFGINLKYLVDEDENMLPCSSTFTSVNKTKTCGENGEFNNRYNPCYTLLSELLFYRNSTE